MLRWMAFKGLGLLWAALAVAQAWAQPPAADTIIRNRAMISYQVEGQSKAQLRFSNEVEIKVAVVESLQLLENLTVRSAPGRAVELPHTLTNTGNAATRYLFSVVVGAGCAGLTNVRVVHDVNSNGVMDPGEAVLSHNAGAGASLPALAPAAGANVLLMADVSPGAPVPSECTLTLTASSALQGAVNSATDRVLLTAGPAFTRNKFADKSGVVLPGDVVNYTVRYQNVGNSQAQGVGVLRLQEPQVLNTGTVDAAGSYPLVINGVSATKVVLRDVVPLGAGFVGGSLGSANATGQLLYRRAGDPPFSYRSAAPPDVEVVEVALAFDSVPANSAIELRLGVRANSSLDGELLNVGDLFYNDGQPTALAQRTNRVRHYTAPDVGPDLTIDKYHAGDFSIGQEASFFLQVSNVGAGATTQPIVVTDVLPEGMRFVSANGPGWSCAQSGQAVSCSLPALPGSTVDAPSRAAPIQLVVTVPLATLPSGQAITTLVNRATVSGGGEASIRRSNNADEDEVRVALRGSLKGRVWKDRNHDRRYDKEEPGLPDWTAHLVVFTSALADGRTCPLPRAAAGTPQAVGQYPAVAPCGLLVANAKTDASGNYAFSDLQAGENYGVYFRSPKGVWYATPVNGEQGRAQSNGQEDTSFGGITGIRVTAGGESFSEQSLPVDSTGVVYDSLSRKPVAEAVLTLAGPVGFNAEEHLIGGAANQRQVTDVAGEYHFALQKDAPVGRYSIQVVPPQPYRFVSEIIPPGFLGGAKLLSVAKAKANAADSEALQIEPGAPQVQLVQANDTAPDLDQDTRYHIELDHVGNGRTIVNNHIPLDPPFSSEPWVVLKNANKKQVEAVDFVDYTVTLNNDTGLPRTDALVHDRPAAGFRYVAGSARVELPNGEKARIEPAVNRTANGGRDLVFDIRLPLLGTTLRRIDEKAALKVTYRMAVSAQALQGDGVNLAWAESRLPVPTKPSNRARHAVKVTPGVFTDDGFIVGKVFLDCNADGEQQPDEFGVPGVRLFVEDGTHVLTDAEGRYSLYGLKATTHVLRLDDTTAPKGARWGGTNNRHPGTARGALSRFVDIKKGELFNANFPEQSCSEAVRREVATRRQAAGAGSELESLVKGAERFSAKTEGASNTDVLTRPSTGVIDPVTGLPRDALNAQGRAGAAGALANGASARPASGVTLEPLEALLGSASDNRLEVLNLKDGQVLGHAQTSIQVKGKLGNSFRLSVNGRFVESSRVGKRSTLASKDAQAWEFVAVALDQGKNTLQVVQVDPMGNDRDSVVLQLTAPGRLAKLRLQAPAEPVADGQTPAIVKLWLTDAEGVPIVARVPVTLTTTVSDWLVNDLSVSEPGVQIMVEGGQADVPLRAPITPAQGTLTAMANDIKAEAPVRFSPELRALMAVGLIDGKVDFSKIARQLIEPTRSNDVFESELTHFSRLSGDGKTQASGRVAFYLKGKILGKYLLTAAYDSDKADDQRLFRDIQPDRYYPLYGDGSVKGFDAQSSGRLYVRVDRDSSYVLLGDFQTQGDSARNLTQISRALNGAKAHIEQGITLGGQKAVASLNAFVSHGNQREILEELRANGITGPFALKFGNILENSEQLDVVVRDRFQPDVVEVLSSLNKPLQRFVDYEVDYDRGELRLRAPLPSFDANGYPVYLRLRYEVRRDGERFWTAGADAQLQLGEHTKVGVVAVDNRDPSRPERLVGAYAQVPLSETTQLVGEVLRSRVAPGNGIDADAPKASDGVRQGQAARIEIQHEGKSTQLRAQVQASSKDFDANGVSLSGGRQEALVEGRLKVSDSTQLKAELRNQQDIDTGARQQVSGVALVQQVSNALSVEAGVNRYDNRNQEPVADAPTPVVKNEQTTTARFKVSGAWPFLPQLSSYLEHERSIGATDRSLTAVGSEYTAQQVRIYGRYELANTLSEVTDFLRSDRASRSAVGAEWRYVENGSVFSEYRLNNGESAAPAQLAYGLRQRIALSDRWSLLGNYERVRPQGTPKADTGQPLVASSVENTAVGLGFEYAGANDSRLLARVENRRSPSDRAQNLVLAASARLGQDWSLLTRNAWERRDALASPLLDATSRRLQLGLAYRPVARSDVNALFKVENRLERDGTTAVSDGDVVSTRGWIASAHSAWQVRPGLELGARWASKWLQVRDNDFGAANVSSNLLFGRLRYDITPQWDVGLQVFVLNAREGARSTGRGLELGYRFNPDLWLSVGVNLSGFREDDLAGSEQTQRGVFLRLRAKWDETWWR